VASCWFTCCICYVDWQSGDYLSSADIGSAYSQTSVGCDLAASGKTTVTLSHGSYGQGKSGNFKKSGKVKEKSEDQKKLGNFTFQSLGKSKYQGTTVNKHAEKILNCCTQTGSRIFSHCLQIVCISIL